MSVGEDLHLAGEIFHFFREGSGFLTVLFQGLNSASERRELLSRLFFLVMFKAIFGLVHGVVVLGLLFVWRQSPGSLLPDRVSAGLAMVRGSMESNGN